MKLRGVIFDMDGLMLDSERVYREIFDRAARDCGLPFTDEIHLRMLGRNSADTRAVLAGAWDDATAIDRFLDRATYHHDTCFAEMPPAIKLGLLDLLDLIESHAVPKAVATSTRRSRALPRLERAGLLHRFDAVATGDEVQHGKPAPDIFLAAAHAIGVEPARCVVLEDSEPGIAGAHAAGMTAIMVPDLKQPCAEVRQLAHGVFPSLLEVREVLRAML